MSVELRHLRYFVALAEAKSFGRAAPVLGIAQPALSQQIRKLEDELDVVLFTRGNGGSHLTAAGEAFMDGARASLAGAAEAVASARMVARGEHGRLSVGFVGSSADNLIPAALRLYWREHPGVKASLVETDPGRLSGCFERNELDVTFARRPVTSCGLMCQIVLSWRCARSSYRWVCFTVLDCSWSSRTATDTSHERPKRKLCAPRHRFGSRGSGVRAGWQAPLLEFRLAAEMGPRGQCPTARASHPIAHRGSPDGSFGRPGHRHTGS